jgi:recombination protein RecA
VRLEVRKTETIDGAGKDEDAVGNRVRVKVVKNKVAPPFRKVELDIIFGKGVSALGGILDAAIKYELIDKKGAWYAYNEEKIGQGRDNVKVYLEERPELAAELDVKLRKIMFPDREGAAKKNAKKTESPSPAARASPETAPPASIEDAALEASLPEPEYDEPHVSPAAVVAQSEPSFEEEPPAARKAPAPEETPLVSPLVSPTVLPKAAEKPPAVPGAPRQGPGRPRKNPNPDGLF